MYIDENDVRTPRERVPKEDMTKYLFSAPVGKEQPRVPGGRDCRGNVLPVGTPLAAVYAPVQLFRELYDHEKALSCGTLFRELDKPFEGRRRR
jgi:hypothetical protein